MPSPNATAALDLGYVPLLDSAPLIIAKEAGFFMEEGLDVRLHRENNWASIRDKLSLNMFAGAHVLAPMVIASHMSKAQGMAGQAFKTAIALGYNGNAITVSDKLATQLGLPAASLAASLRSLQQYLTTTAQTLTIGTVYPHSMHTFLIHLLLKRAGIGLSQVEIKVIPPVHMVDAMQDGIVDLFCVGEPWNTAAQISKAGKILCYGSELWDSAPEKVLAVSQAFAAQRPSDHEKLLQAIIRACQWLEQPDHLAQAALWIASDQYLSCSSDLLIQAMLNQWYTRSRPHQQRKIFYSMFANAPWPNHAKWIHQALQQVEPFRSTPTLGAIELADIYDWSTYSKVMQALDLPLPAADQQGLGPQL